MITKTDEFYSDDAFNVETYIQVTLTTLVVALVIVIVGFVLPEIMYWYRKRKENKK